MVVLGFEPGAPQDGWHRRSHRAKGDRPNEPQF